jgi:16S rRNA (uracil1498-N3)-methyltransferase
MHRFYLPPGQCHPPLLTLTGGEAHHARDVLRLKPGDEVAVLDGAGREFSCAVRALARREVTLAVRGTRVAAPPPARITLAQAIPRGKLFESIIQKATELGVAAIIPLLSERVATRLDAAAARDKAEKWRQTAIEAIKQCGQPWLPQVLEPLSLPDLLARKDLDERAHPDTAPTQFDASLSPPSGERVRERGSFDPPGAMPRCTQYELALVGSLQGDGRHPRQYFDEFRAQHQRAPQTVCAWIGPEGDFTAEELDLIRAAGARPISLGPLVLRSETAALYTLAVINYEMPFNSPAPPREIPASGG